MRKLEMSRGWQHSGHYQRTQCTVQVQTPDFQVLEGSGLWGLSRSNEEGQTFLLQVIVTWAVPGLVWVGVYISLLSQWLGGFSWHPVACIQGHLSSCSLVDCPVLRGISCPLKTFRRVTSSWEKLLVIIQKHWRGLSRMTWQDDVQTGHVVHKEGQIQKDGNDGLRKIRRPRSKDSEALWRDEDQSQQQQEGWWKWKEGGHWEANSRDI